MITAAEFLALVIVPLIAFCAAVLSVVCPMALSILRKRIRAQQHHK